MTNWRYSGNKKKHFRKLNKALRQMNKNIEQDDLWRGQFYAKPIAHQWHHFEDGSGWSMWVVIRFTDRATGIIWDIADDVNSLCFGAKLWWYMNEFITERTPTWSNPSRSPYSSEYKEMIDKYVKEGWPY